MRIPTIDSKEIPEAAQEQAYLYDTLRESPRNIPTLTAAARAKRQFAGVIEDVGLRIQDAYDASKLAEAETDLLRQYSELDSQMQDPEFKKQHSWDQWDKIYTTKSDEIRKTVNDKYKKLISGKAKNEITTRAERYDIQYGARNGTRVTMAKVQEIETDIIKVGKDYERIGFTSYMNGNMSAVADTVTNYRAYLAGQVSATVLTAEEADAKARQMENNLVKNIWEHRVYTEPDKAWKELDQMHKDLESATKAEFDGLLDMYGMEVEEIVNYKEKAEKAMESALTTNNRMREYDRIEAERVIKEVQKETVKPFLIKSERGEFLPQDQAQLDALYRVGHISKEDYKTINSVNRGMVGKITPEKIAIETKERAKAIESISEGKGIPKSFTNEFNAGNIRPEKYLSIVKLGADKEYLSGSTFIARSMKPGIAAPEDEPLQKQRSNYAKAMLKYDVIISTPEDQRDDKYQGLSNRNLGIMVVLETQDMDTYAKVQTLSEKGQKFYDDLNNNYQSEFKKLKETEKDSLVRNKKITELKEDRERKLNQLRQIELREMTGSSRSNETGGKKDAYYSR